MSFRRVGRWPINAMRRFLSSCSSIGAVIWAVLCNFISVSLLHLSHPWNSILFSPFLFLFYPRLISGTHIISRMSVRLAYPVLSPVPSLFPSQIELLVSAFRSSLSPCTKTLSVRFSYFPSAADGLLIGFSDIPRH